MRQVQELALFGLHAVTPRFAMTYELPIVKQVDYTDLREFQQMSGGLPPG